MKNSLKTAEELLRWLNGNKSDFSELEKYVHSKTTFLEASLGVFSLSKNKNKRDSLKERFYGKQGHNFRHA